MSDEAIMENYGNIQAVLDRVVELEKFVRTLATRYEMLDERIIKLETIIVELANNEPPEEHFSMEELAEISLENRANEDRGEDR